MRSNEYDIDLTNPNHIPWSYLPTDVFRHLFTVEMREMPNTNDLLYMMPRARSGEVRRTRDLGYKTGLSVAKELGIGRKVIQRKGGGKSMRDYAVEVASEYLTRQKVFCLLAVWHAESEKTPGKALRKQDIYNPMTKALIDGLTDAGLWEDDNASIHTDYWVSYRGLAVCNLYRLSFFSYVPEGATNTTED